MADGRNIKKKFKKSPYLLNSLTDFDENLAWYCIWALRTSLGVRNVLF